MDIKQKATELGEMIKKSEEMIEFKKCELAQMQDEDARKLMQEFNLQRMNLARDMQSGKISEEEAVTKNNEAFEKMLSSSEVIKNYVEAKKKVDALVGEINGILNYYITGQDPNCTHDCSTCGGCH